MFNNKRTYFSVIVSVLLVFAMLFTTACGNADAPETTTADSQATSSVADDNNQGASGETASQPDGEPATEEIVTEAAFVLPEKVEEIVALFNQSANRIKTEATKVTKNFEKRYNDSSKLIVPDILMSTADTMMSTFMKDDTDPIVYATREEIVAEYIVPDQNYVSKLTADAVKEAKCTDKGDTYEIYIKLKDEKNPTAGKGVGAVCDVIETHEIADKAPSMLKEMSTSYYNCTVTVTVDKASGRVIHAVYSTPLVMHMIVNLFGTHEVQAGITFTKDYTIEY
ncbi:MAG: hypothetical protein J6R20_02450 [Clostridia bacterium]|nr:hypothetical protein [Clostridia bacterium]